MKDTVRHPYEVQQLQCPLQVNTGPFRMSGSLYHVTILLAATKQLYEWFSLSVRPSVRLSVTPF